MVHIVIAAVALAGCSFLIYFQVALWRDARSATRVRIRKLTGVADLYDNGGKLLRMRRAEQAAFPKRSSDQRIRG